MNWIKRIQILMLVILVFFGTTGVTVYHHICACSTPAAFTQQSCCEPAETPSCCEAGTAEMSRPNDAGPVGCGHDHNGCKDIPLYFKASLIGLPVLQKQQFNLIQPVFDLPVTSLTVIFDLDGELLDADRNPDPPPLRAGRNLVLYLHQAKIPFSA